MSKNYQVDILINAVDKTSAKIAEIEAKINAFASSQQKIMATSLVGQQKLNKAKIEHEKIVDESEKKARKRTPNPTLEEIRQLRKKEARLKTEIQEIKKGKAASDKSNSEIAAKTKQLNLVNEDIRKQQSHLSKMRQAGINERKAEADILLKTARANHISSYGAINSERQRAAMQTRAERASQRAADRRQSGRESTYGALAAGTGTIGAVGSAFSLKNYMERETGLMRSRLLFGREEGAALYQEATDFAMKTAFSVRDATKLLEAVKLGSVNLGVTDPQQMMELTKKLAVPILAYVGNREDRNEVTNQMAQIMGKGVANTRQDLQVMAARGLPILQMVSEFETQRTGKYQNIGDVFDKYGAELPAKLLIQTLEYFSTKPELIAATKERSKMFTQAFDTSTETLQVSSASIGQAIDKSFELGQLLNAASKSMIDIGFSVFKKDEKGNLVKDELGNNVISETAKTVIKAIGASALILGASWLLPKIKRSVGNFAPSLMNPPKVSPADYMDGSVLDRINRKQTTKQKAMSSIRGLGQGINPATAVSIAGAAVIDYNRVANEIIKNPTEGLMNNMVELSIAATAAATPLGRIVLLFNMLAGAGFIKNPLKVLSGEAQATEINRGEYSFREKIADKFTNFMVRQDAARISDPKARENFLKSNLLNTDDVGEKIKAFGEKNNSTIINVQTQTIVDGQIQPSKTKTAVKSRDPYGNTLTKQVFN